MNSNWNKARSPEGLGASDAAGAVGVSPRETRRDACYRKIHQLEPEQTAYMHFGKKLEKIIIDEVRQRLKCPVRANKETLQASRKWMFATPDAFVNVATKRACQTICDLFDANGQYFEEFPRHGLLECKTAGWAAEWRDGVPLHYQVQTQHQLYTARLQWAVVAVLIGGSDFRMYPVTYSPRAIRKIVREEAFFMRCVRMNTPELLSDEITIDLSRVWPQDNGAIVLLPPEAEDWDAELQQLKQQRSSAEKRIKQLENQIKECLRSATYGTLPSGGTYSWRQQTRKSYTVAETTYRKLHRHQQALTSR